MSEKYKVRNPEGIYFITIIVTDWFDLFVRSIYKEIVIDPLKYCAINKGLVIYAYVIMTSHIHMIVSSLNGSELSDTIRDFKKCTSKKLIQSLLENIESRKERLLEKLSSSAERIKQGVNYKLWQDGFHPIELNTNQMIDQRLDYIHNNPVEEGIVEHPEDYLYSSARNYSEMHGMIEVTKI